MERSNLVRKNTLPSFFHSRSISHFISALPSVYFVETGKQRDTNNFGSTVLFVCFPAHLSYYISSSLFCFSFFVCLKFTATFHVVYALCYLLADSEFFSEFSLMFHFTVAVLSYTDVMFTYCCVPCLSNTTHGIWPTSETLYSHM
jgi:hypothetical protein